MSYLVVEHIYKSYQLGKTPVEVLRDVDASIPKGALVALLGKSGSGKSTLLHIMGALDRPTSGKVFIGNEDITGMDARSLAQYRNNNVGFVFQFHHLLPEFSAVENVAMPAWISRRSDEKVNGRARELLTRLGLGHRTSHKPSELSGGEQQRVAIARALMNRPRVVLADEPTGNLDDQTSQPLMEMIVELNQTEETTFVIATHDEEVARLADQVLYLYDGQIHTDRRQSSEPPTRSL